MNDDNFLDLLRINEALVLVSELTDTIESDESIRLGQLSCLMWLCQDKFGSVMGDIRTQRELLAKQALLTPQPL